MFCTNCGCEISEEDNFCRVCGKKLINEAATQQSLKEDSETALPEPEPIQSEPVQSQQELVQPQPEPIEKGQQKKRGTGFLVGAVIAGGLVLMIVLGCLIIWAKGKASRSLERWRQEEPRYYSEEWQGNDMDEQGYF